MRALLRRLARLVPRRGISPTELMIGAIAVLLALASCHDRPAGPAIIVDPGPPFGPRPSVRVHGARRLADGSILLVLQRETAH